MIYLRNRYYDPSTGRFISEDPVKDGMNWYVYCGNDPVNMVDPLGLEYIVVSGGDYSDDSHAGYSYNFIEPAIKKIRDLRSSNSSERIGWCIANAGWTSNDWKNFQSAVEGLNVNIIVIDSANDLTNYINYRSTAGEVVTPDGAVINGRAGDEITKFAVFSHGWRGTLALGYNYGSYDTALDFSVSNIAGVKSSAFNNPNSWFYSCNTATGGNSSFLNAWQSKVGGFAGGYAGTTTYAFITYSEAYSGYWNTDPRKWSEKSTVDSMRKQYGFSAMGSLRYPTGSIGVSQVTYGVSK